MFDKEKTILFYTPEAEVVEHLQLQAIVAKTVQEQGYNVAFARCFKMFGRCPARDMHNLPHSRDYHYEPNAKEEDLVCTSCIHKSSNVLDSYDLPFINLWQHATIDCYANATRALNNAPANLLEFTYDGYEFGRATLMDVIWNTKISNFETIKNKYKHHWLNYLHAAIVSYELLNTVVSNLNIGKIVHFNEYSLLQASRFVAHKHNISASIVTATAHCGGDLSKLVITPKCYRVVANDLIEQVPQVINLSLTKKMVEECADDVIARQKTKTVHVYSPAKTFSAEDIREQLGLDKEKKIVVVYTSSLDEWNVSNLSMQVAGDERSYVQPFQPIEGSYQVGWIKELENYLKDRKDLQVIVRIHPREASNKRDSNFSDHLDLLKKHFSSPPDNFKVIWPQEQVSSYDLGEIADLVLTMYSGTGSEFARLAVPVLASYKGISIVDTKAVEWADNKSDYFKKFEDLLANSDNVDIENSKIAFRGYASYSINFGLDLSDIIGPDTKLNHIQKYVTPRVSKEITTAIIEDKSSLEINLQHLESIQDENLKQQEKYELLKQLKRLLNFVLTGKDIVGDFHLLWINNVGEAENCEVFQSTKNIVRIFSVNNKYIKYIDKGKEIYKYSPMATRLAKLCYDTKVNIESNSNQLGESNSTPVSLLI